MKNSVSAQPIKQPESTSQEQHMLQHSPKVTMEGNGQGRMSPRVKPGTTEHNGETISSESRTRGFQMN